MSTVSLSGEPASNSNKKGRLFELKTRLKKKKRRKDLEQLRRNVLAAKRTFKLRSRQTQCPTSSKLSKNSLKKTLNMFAGIRQENENKTQGLIDKKSSKKLNGRMICARLLPEPVIGIFKNGAKGKEARRENATNSPLYRTNEARLHDDVFKLLNGDENYSSSNKTSLDNGNDSDNLDPNDKSEDKRDFYSILQHHFSPVRAMKCKSTFNNESSPKLISNCVRLESGGEERRIASRNVSKNVQRVDKYEKFISTSGHKTCDYDTIALSRIEEHFSQRKHNVDDGLMQKELPGNAIGNKMQSIKRWGICPVLCYDEFCSKIHEEQFSFSHVQSNSSDPIMQIRTALSALYAEAHEQQTDTNITSKVSSTSSNSIATKITSSNQNSIIHNNQTSSVELNPSSNSSFVQSSHAKYPTAKSKVKFDNKLYDHEQNSWDINGISSQCSESQSNFLQKTKINPDKKSIFMNLKNIHEFSQNFDDDEEIPCEYTEYQVDKLLDFDYTTVPSPSKNWRATIDKQKTSVPRNVKYVPTILRRPNSKSGNLVDIDLSKYHEINDSNNLQGSQNETLILKHHLLDGNTNICLPPNTVTNVKNSKKSGRKSLNTGTTRIHEFVAPYDSDNSDYYFDRVEPIKHQTNTNISAYSEPQNFDNFQQFPHSSSWDYDPPLLENLIGDDIEPLLQVNNDEFYPRKNRCNIYPTNIVKASTQLPNINQTTPLPHHPISTYCKDYTLVTDVNSELLTNNYYDKPHDQKITRVKSADQSHWRTSNFGHNMNNKSTLLPMNRQDTLRHYGRHCSSTNMDINGPVLQYFKSLSFHENNPTSSLVDDSRCCIANKDRRSSEFHSNLHRPSKYYAVSNESSVDQVPRRVPVHLNAEKLQFMKETRPCRMNVLKQNAGKCVAATYKLNFDSDMRTASICAKNQNNSCSIPIKFNRNFSVNNFDGLAIPIETSLKSKTASDACEVLLDDGRIGLFVPRNCHQNNQLKLHSLNKYNSDQHKNYCWG